MDRLERGKETWPRTPVAILARPRVRGAGVPAGRVLAHPDVGYPVSAAELEPHRVGRRRPYRGQPGSGDDSMPCCGRAGRAALPIGWRKRSPMSGMRRSSAAGRLPGEVKGSAVANRPRARRRGGQGTRDRLDGADSSEQDRCFSVYKCRRNSRETRARARLARPRRGGPAGHTAGPQHHFVDGLIRRSLRASTGRALRYAAGQGWRSVRTKWVSSPRSGAV